MGLSRTWMRKAQPHIVNLFRPKQDHVIWRYLRGVPITGGGVSEDWFIYLEPPGSKPSHYDELLGLIPPEGPTNWQA